VYEEYVAFCVNTLKARHEQMVRPRSPVEVAREDADEDLPMLNRMAIYAARPVIDALRDAEKADHLWRQAADGWQYTPEAPMWESTRSLVSAWATADVATKTVMETIRREMIAGKPRRIRWARRQQREAVQQAVGTIMSLVKPDEDSASTA
jgi:hypothetical protein